MTDEARSNQSVLGSGVHASGAVALLAVSPDDLREESAARDERAGQVPYALAVWKLLRPRGFAAAYLFVLSGWVLAAPHAPAAIARDLALLFVGYVILLSGGTLLFNSAYDRDTGSINFEPAPPPVPAGLAPLGLAFKAGAVALFATRGALPAALAAVLAVMSVAYSRGIGTRRLKEVPGADFLINAFGYGLLSVALGVSTAGAPVTTPVWLVGAAFSLSLGGTFPASQLFQHDRDARESRNLASLLGPARSLWFTAAMLATAWALLTLEQARATDAGVASAALFVVFSALFAAGIVQSLRWARTPLERAEPRLRALLVTMIVARVVWIASVALR